MSCEFDYGWDSPKRITKIREISFSVTAISKKDISAIEEAMILCLDRKLEKLNLLLKQMNVYQVGDCLIVNDRYNTALNFTEIVKSFGMDINQLAVQGLRGKNYIIGDKITKLLNILGTNYDFSHIVDVKELPSTINSSEIELINYSSLESVYDDELSRFLKEIKNSGLVKVEVTKSITSIKKRVIERLEKYLLDIKKQACENNKNVQLGTTEILYERARQMGYSVQKEVKGNEVQLVLVRIE